MRIPAPPPVRGLPTCNKINHYARAGLPAPETLCNIPSISSYHNPTEKKEPAISVEMRALK
jgi:hypothetical protein